MRWHWLGLLGAVAVAAGCGQKVPENGPPKPPEVEVAYPVRKEVTDYEEFTGRTDAVKMVEVRARATGYLDKINFEDGAVVKEGQVLFEIDPRPYQAALAQAVATVEQNEARQARLKRDFDRAEKLLKDKSISQEEFDKVKGDKAEADAAVDVAKAARDLAKINLDYTKVRAPIAGKISRRLVDPGNLVKADDTLLTTIVAQGELYAYFDVDERTVLRLRRLIKDGKLSSIKDNPMYVGLADQDAFPIKGTINFEDNKIDSGTGTLRLRGIFDNPGNLIAPGQFIRVQLPIGAPHKAWLVAERALATDQGQKFLYILNATDEAIYTPVKVGALQGGLRVIEEGIKGGERIIVSGLQRVRPNAAVTPKPVEMTPVSNGGNGARP